MTRTFTLILVPADDPDELDAMSYEERRERSGGFTTFELLYPGEPDTLVRKALDIDQGVYGAARAWDDESSSVEETAAIFHSELAAAAEMLKPHLADPIALARTLIDHAESGEDEGRVARALVEPMRDPARGPAEEAATYVRVFLENVPFALESLLSVAWEIRRPAACACAVHEGRTLGRYVTFSPRVFERLPGGGKYFGRMRCTTCNTTYAFEISADCAVVTRETTPVPTEIGAFARDVAVALGGEVAFEIAQNPTCAVRIGAHCRVLVWRYGAFHRVALPHSTPWIVRSREAWIELVPAVERALAGEPAIVTMADVVASLPRTWNLGLQGEPRPEEALLFDDRGFVNLKQNAESVTISIREGDTVHSRELATLDALVGLSAWIDGRIASQAESRRAAREELEAANARAHAEMTKDAPDFEDVIGALRAGHTVQVGGGRSFVTYAIRHVYPIVIRTDDGFTEEVACSEQTLRDAIAEAPHVFASVVRDWQLGPAGR